MQLTMAAAGAGSSSSLSSLNYANGGLGAATLLGVLVLVRNRLVEQPSSHSHSRRSRPPGTPFLSTPQIEEATRRLFEPQKDGSRVLLVPTSDGRISRVTIRPTRQSTFAAHRQHFVGPRKAAASSSAGSSVGSGGKEELAAAAADGAQAIAAKHDDQGEAPSARAQAQATTSSAAAGAGGQRASRDAANKVRVNKEFFRQLRAIFRILIPRWGSEGRLFVRHTVR